MSAKTAIRDVSRTVSVLANCAQACRRLTDPSNGVLLFSYPSKFLQLLNDCAATCDLAVLFIERKSPIVVDFLEVCEEVSLECARECSNYNTAEFDLCTKACENVAGVCLSYLLGKEPL
jgi:hypothetical protein